MDINDLDFINITFNSVLVICSVFNISLNILLVYLIKTKCDLKSTEIILILVLCCIEITEGSEVLLLAILKFFFGYQFLNKDTLQCQVYGFIMQMFLRIEITMVTVLSIIRYTMVWYKWDKSLKFWLCLLLLGLCPATGFFLYGALFGMEDQVLVIFNATLSLGLNPDLSGLCL
ncbi:hypothetical protein CONCODRAFT_13057 [Conidiobolus coronatus NRRL 28638]|uniref:G-protein coupled receptors family 1 profile domain-containing protein n=1 Tax=Conidiobolus coronatus (strain ATCC 28846 / CBS 209.66 / NRRL 28638) TaxID=796925 RepID=A0A137NRL1_CONC2|nr:hypothetical protein CONCODRAFT_13057 [Conidiobolus coronatus NRRL 28638]|eukprot:KXN65368.1 hypothetical protein CONCODRAFT_13057 [Conidiobolus coronatus NRRL 28638]